jgi:hypothetical protein
MPRKTNAASWHAQIVSGSPPRQKSIDTSTSSAGPPQIGQPDEEPRKKCGTAPSRVNGRGSAGARCLTQGLPELLPVEQPATTTRSSRSPAIFATFARCKRRNVTFALAGRRQHAPGKLRSNGSGMQGWFCSGGGAAASSDGVACASVGAVPACASRCRYGLRCRCRCGYQSVLNRCAGNAHKLSGRIPGLHVVVLVGEVPGRRVVGVYGTAEK